MTYQINMPEDQKPARLTSRGAIRLFEQELVSARTIAASEEAFGRYQDDILPELPPAQEALVAQGFGAGYAYAMDRVRKILLEIQQQLAEEDRART